MTLLMVTVEGFLQIDPDDIAKYVIDEGMTRAAAIKQVAQDDLGFTGFRVNEVTE